MGAGWVAGGRRGRQIGDSAKKLCDCTAITECLLFLRFPMGSGMSLMLFSFNDRISLFLDQEKMFLHMWLGDMLTFIKSYFFKKSDAAVIVIYQVPKMKKKKKTRKGGRRKPGGLNLITMLYSFLNDWRSSFRFIRGTGVMVWPWVSSSYDQREKLLNESTLGPCLYLMDSAAALTENQEHAEGTCGTSLRPGSPCNSKKNNCVSSGDRLPGSSFDVPAVCQRPQEGFLPLGLSLPRMEEARWAIHQLHTWSA